MGLLVWFNILMKILAVCQPFAVSRVRYLTVLYVSIWLYFFSIWNNVSIYKTSVQLIWVVQTALWVGAVMPFCPILFLFKHCFPCYFFLTLIYFFAFQNLYGEFIVLILCMEFTDFISIFQLLSERGSRFVLMSPGHITSFLL
jgi:hypothetical protein